MVSDQILGCWVMGGTWGGADDKDSIEAIMKAYEEALIVLIPYVYGRGRSERIVGRQQNQCQGRITVITNYGKRIWKRQGEYFRALGCGAIKTL